MQRRQGIIQIAENRGRVDLNTRDSGVNSASTFVISRCEVGLPRVQGHPVTDPQTESNGNEVEPRRDFLFAAPIHLVQTEPLGTYQFS